MLFFIDYCEYFSKMWVIFICNYYPDCINQACSLQLVKYFQWTVLSIVFMMITVLYQLIRASVVQANFSAVFSLLQVLGHALFLRAKSFVSPWSWRSMPRSCLDIEDWVLDSLLISYLNIVPLNVTMAWIYQCFQWKLFQNFGFLISKFIACFLSIFNSYFQVLLKLVIEGRSISLHWPVKSI